MYIMNCKCIHAMLCYQDLYMFRKSDVSAHDPFQRMDTHTLYIDRFVSIISSRAVQPRACALAFVFARTFPALFHSYASCPRPSFRPLRL